MCAYQPKKRYYLKDQLAYTEDHVLVKSLFLMNVSPNLELKQLRVYFQKYGHIVRLHLFLSGDKRKKLKHGYVSFSNPLHAAKVLQRKVHYVQGRRLCVLPSDSWHQPDAKEVIPKDVAKDEPPAAIMALNDHCLEHILCMLSLPDRIHFARTCVRFRNIYLGLSPKLDKLMRFDAFETLTVWDLRDFFQLSGANIKHIEGIIPYRHCKRLCEFLGMHCINLQSMRIMANTLTKANMCSLFAKLGSLEFLEMRGCNLTDQNAQALKMLTKLKQLDLSHNEKLNGQVSLPATIESLTLNYCAGIKPHLLRKMLGSFKQLKALHIKGIPLYPCIQKLLSDASCASLESLTLSCDDLAAAEYKQLALLPSLKRLVLNLQRKVEPLALILEALVEHKSQQLEHFEIRTPNCISAGNLLKIGALSALRTLNLPHNEQINDRELEDLFKLSNLQEINLKYCPNITNNGVLRLILACPKLQLLHLEECAQLSEQLLLEIIAKLSKSSGQHVLPIQLFVSGSQVQKIELDELGKSIIKVVYAMAATSENDFLNMYDVLFNLSDEEDDDLDSLESFGSYISYDDYDDDDYDDDDDDNFSNYGYNIHLDI